MRVWAVEIGNDVLLFTVWLKALQTTDSLPFGATAIVPNQVEVTYQGQSLIVMSVVSTVSIVEGTICHLPADLNGDGRVDVIDIMLVASHWGERCP